MTSRSKRKVEDSSSHENEIIEEIGEKENSLNADLREPDESHPPNSPIQVKAGYPKRQRTLAHNSDFSADAALIDSSELDIPEEEATVFEAGMILRVHMEQFMCHTKFTMQFGKMLNFLIGENGSGR
jgi:hypothetical protein